MKQSKKIVISTQSTPGSAPVNTLYKRGCGWPIAGGTYISVPFGVADPDGRNKTPIWNCVLCPTYQIPDPQDFGLAAINMCLKFRGYNAKGQEIWDIWDWIGASAYPEATDWLKEVQMLGFHQKIDPNLLTKLVPESMYYAVHSRASFVDPTAYYETRLDSREFPVCPSNHEQHLNPPAGDKQNLGTCISLLFNDLHKAVPVTKGERLAVRQMPSFTYEGFIPPPGVQVQYIPAAFFKLNIGRMATFLVYKDDASHTEQKALDILAALDEKMKRVKVVSLDGTPTT